MDLVWELPFNNQSLYAQNQSIWFTSVGLDLHQSHISCFALLFHCSIPEYYPNHTSTSYSLASQYRFDSTSVNLPLLPLSFPLKLCIDDTNVIRKRQKKKADEKMQNVANRLAQTDRNDKKRLKAKQSETKLDIEATTSDWVRAKCIQICACISVPRISYRMIHFYFAHTSPPDSHLPLQSLHITSQIHSFILSRYTQRFDLIYSVLLLISPFLSLFV